ncbi:hypothetical protein FQZ97_839400 [compost metagenome]
MGADHAAGAHALGAGRLDEVHADHFQHGGAGQPHVNGHEEAAQRHRRQDEVLGDVAGAGPSGQPGAHGFHAEGRQPAQHHREQQDTHQRQPEERRGIEQQGARHDRAVDPAALVAVAGLGRHDAQEDAQHDGKHEGAGHQQERGGQALDDQVQHRDVVPVREAQVQLGHAFQVQQQLGQDGLVQPEGDAQLFDVGGVAGPGLARQHGGGVAGRQADQEEIDDHHAQHDHQGLADAGQEERQEFHAWAPP